MKNENQKPKLSFRDVFKIKNEICESNVSCDTCPFCKKDSCIVSGDNIARYVDEIEAICTEWEMNRPTLAEKINKILKPYGMKLDRNYIFCFTDKNVTEDGVVNKLYTTKWKESQMSKWILLHDINTRATLSININHIEAITKRDDGGSLIVTESGDRIKVRESVSEVAQKVADA